MYNLIAIITVKEFDLFEKFERNASRIMKKYHGHIERAFEIERDPNGTGKEFHFIQFPNEESFQNYRNDPELANLRDLQSNAVSAMEVTVLGDEKRY